MWVAADKEDWVYASATSFTIAGDYRAVYSAGMRIKLTQDPVKYFTIESVIYSAPNTTVTVSSSTYSLVNAVITDRYFSYARSPIGWHYTAELEGPASATDGDLAEFNGITGRKLKDGGLSHANVQDAIGKRPVYGRVTGSNATTTGQTLVDIPGLSIALLANSVYKFKAVLSVGTSAVTTGTEYGVNFSAAGATVEAHITGSYTSAAAKEERISALNSPSNAFLTTSGQTGGIDIQGIIVTGANPGNLTIRHLKVTSGTSTVYINSFLEVIKIA